MTEIVQGPEVFRGVAAFQPPPNLWAVARSELSAANYDRLAILYAGIPLTPERYVKFIEETRRDA